MRREQRNSVIVIITFALLLKRSYQKYFHRNRDIKFLSNSNSTWVSSDVEPEDSFTIHTPGCFIPNLHYLDQTIRPFIEYPNDAPKCKHSRNPLLKANQTHIIVIEENVHHFVKTSKSRLSCCYSGIVIHSHSTGHKTKTAIVYEPCVIFNDIIMVAHEFVRVTCNVDYEQFFFFTPVKPFTSSEVNFFEGPELQSSYNILILGLSSVSRLNFQRTMPNTLKLLKSKEVIDMAGYNTISDKGLLYDMLAMFVGLDKKQLEKTCMTRSLAPLDKCPFVWQRFKDIGYYTALVEDSTKLDSIFNSKPVDYYVYPMVKEIERLNHKNNSRACMGNKYYFQVMLDYVQKLMATVRRHKLFCVYWESSITEKRTNYPMLMDHSYENFIKALDRSGHLNNTIVFFVSDQGVKHGDISLTKQGGLEKRLPFLKILVPRSFRQRFNLAYENLKTNSLRLTTPYDLFNTLIDLIDLNAVNNDEVLLRSAMTSIKDKSISLFLQVPANRTCNLAGINSHYCTCLESKNLPKNSEEARGATTFLMKEINEILSPYIQCYQLKVDRTVEAMELMNQYEDGHEREWQDIVVTVQAEPGGGLFKSIVRYYRLPKPSWALVSGVYRVNALEDLTQCLPIHFKLKPFCHCKANA